MSDMKLQIKNIGPINEADIKLGKLNIIGGQNGSGKSTSSRLLYCFLYAASPQGSEMFDDIVKSSLHRIGLLLSEGIVAEIGQSVINIETDGEKFELNEDEIERVYEIRDKIDDRFKNNTESFRELLQLWYDLIDDLNFEGKDFYYDELNRLYNKTDDLPNKRRFLNIVANLYKSEFGYIPFDDTFDAGTCCFSGKLDDDEDKFYNWTLYVGEDKSQEEGLESSIDPELSGNVTYIDTISPLETLRFADSLRLPHHFKSLFEKLTDKSKVNEEYEDEFNYKLNIFQDKLNHLIKGKFEYASNDHDLDEHAIVIGG